MMTEFQVGDRVTTDRGRGVIVGSYVDHEGTWLRVVLDGDPDAVLHFDMRDVDIIRRSINDPAMYDKPLFDLTGL